MNPLTSLFSVKKTASCVFLFFLLLCSCNDKNTKIDSIVDYFDTRKPLTHKNLDIQDDSNSLLEPNEIVVHDNLLVVAQARSENFFFAC
jgi:hypothetical protein